MHILVSTFRSSSEGRLEKNVRAKMTASKEQWLMQSRMVDASCGENNIRRK